MFLPVYHLQCAILKQQKKKLFKTRLTVAYKSHDQFVTCINDITLYSDKETCGLIYRHATQLDWCVTIEITTETKFGFGSRRDFLYPSPS